jgi:hypothetical protein
LFSNSSNSLRIAYERHHSYSPLGVVGAVFYDAPQIPSGTHDFLGLLSSEPLGRVQFVETEEHAHTTPVVLLHLYADRQTPPKKKK